MDIDTCYGSVSKAIFDKASEIKLLICDVDGVFSDGRIYMGNDGEELKTFHTRDGFGIKALQNAGIEVAVITGRQSNIVVNRMTALGVSHIYQGQENKVLAFDSILQALELQPEQCAYIGDDVIDLPVMQKVGLSVAVADAHPIVRSKADWKTSIAGGHGAVRECCDLLLQAQGQLEFAQGLSI